MINFFKIKQDLQKQNEKRKLLILQALRWNLTKAESIEYRKNIISSFIKNDIFDFQGNSSIIVELLKTSNESIRMSSARLINAFASLNQGI
jgi:hypothetical protein